MDARTDTASTTSAANPAPAAAAPSPAPARRSGFNRQRLFLILGVVVAVGAVIWLVDWILVGSHHVSTDDAYVKADSTIVSPKVSGYLSEVLVADNESVKAGQLLARIDDRDFKTALDQARAEVDSPLFAHAADVTQPFHGRRFDAGEFAQRGVVQDHVGGHRALGGYFAPQFAQTLEQPLVHVAPRGFFESRPLRFGFFRLQQRDRASAAHHFP